MRQKTFAIGLASLLLPSRHQGPGRSDGGIAGRDDAGLGRGEAEEG